MADKKEKPPIIVSACLAGVRCRYDGDHRRNEAVARLVVEGKALPVCPEQLGGLPTPREPAQFTEGDGEDLLAGRGELRTASGTDVSEAYRRGAKEVERIALEIGARRAILCDKSPACGTTRVWRNGELVEGRGVCAALLSQAGLVVESPKEE